jgi:hypothetical protein
VGSYAGATGSGGGDGGGDGAHHCQLSGGGDGGMYLHATQHLLIKANLKLHIEVIFKCGIL